MRYLRAYNLGELFDKNELKQELQLLNFHITEERSEDRVLWIIEHHKNLAVLFLHGNAVFWNFKPEEEALIIEKLLKTLKIKYKKPYSIELSCKKATSFSIRNDHINLKSFKKDIMIAISFALLQSVELDHIEHFIGEIIQPIKNITEELEKKGKIGISSEQIKKFIGRILNRKHEINIKLNLIDTPEYFWENPEIESYYHKSRNYFEIDQRTETINLKLSNLQDTLEILRDEKNAHHTAKLELIIIILILIEIIQAFMF